MSKDSERDGGAVLVVRTRSGDCVVYEAWEPADGRALRHGIMWEKQPGACLGLVGTDTRPEDDWDARRDPRERGTLAQAVYEQAREDHYAAVYRRRCARAAAGHEAIRRAFPEVDGLPGERPLGGARVVIRDHPALAPQRAALEAEQARHRRAVAAIHARSQWLDAERTAAMPAPRQTEAAPS